MQQPKKKKKQSSQQVHREKAPEPQMKPKPKLWVCSQHWKDEDKSFVETKLEAKVWWIQLSFKAFQKEGSTARACYVWCHHS